MISLSWRNATMSEKFQTLYINTSNSNEATLGGTFKDNMILPVITWRTLLVEILDEDLDWLKKSDGENFQDHFGISEDELDNTLSDWELEKYFDDISFHHNNYMGPSAKAFNLIRNLSNFPTDIDGNGYYSGIELTRTYADGPRVYAYVENKDAEDWLKTQFASEGLDIKLKRI